VKEAQHTITRCGCNPRVFAPVSNVDVLIRGVEATAWRKASVGTIEVRYGLACWWFGAFDQVGNAGVSRNVGQRCCNQGGRKSDHGRGSGVVDNSGVLNGSGPCLWAKMGGLECSFMYLSEVATDNV
jgi:hypothetical protein